MFVSFSVKEKSEILLQVDELTNVKNELSDELADMHTQLEQERSKVSSLKVELTKAQVIIWFSYFPWTQKCNHKNKGRKFQNF